MEIKHLRELRNFTQSYVAEQLSLSLSGYSKIERNETDISISRLEKIAKVLETDLSTLLSFDTKHVFNIHNNQTANGVVQNQQILTDQKASEFFSNVNDELKQLKQLIRNMKTNDA